MIYHVIKLSQNGDFVSKYPSSVAAILKPSFRDHVTRLGSVPYFPDMSWWTSGPIFSGDVRFFPDFDRGKFGGDFENYAEPTTHVFRYF